MHVVWGLLMMAVGLFMMICGSIQSEFVVYRIMVSRSKILWGKAVHRFYQVSGLIVLLLGLLWATGMIWVG